MDLRWLESFLAVTRHGSFTLAARELCLTQPGISRHIQKLERELGVTLIERGYGAVRLTPAGERFHAYAEGMLERHRRLVQELREVTEATETVAGDLSIAASTTPGEFLVPGLVAQFTEQYPRVRPQVYITDSTRVVEDILQRRRELGFVGARLPGRGLRYKAIGEDELVLAVPAGHPFAVRGTVELDALAGQPFLEREGGSGTLLSVRRALAQRKLSLPPYRCVMILSSTEAIVSAVENGYGIGWVSSLALEHRNAGRVALVRIAGLPLRRVLYLVHEDTRPLPPPAAAFVEWEQRQRQAPPSTPETT